MTGEKKIENKIKEYLKSKKAYFIKHHSDNHDKVGIPDILCCYKGIFIGIEVKDIGKKPSEAQWVHIRNINKRGGIAFYTDNVENVKKIIGGIDNEREYENNYRRSEQCRKNISYKLFTQ